MEKNFIDHCKTRFFRLFCFVTIFTMFVTATACDNKDEPGKGVSEEFKCSAETLYFPVEGDNIILTVISPVKPEVTISESWAAVGSFETTGTLNNTYKITFTATENLGGNKRSAIATVKAGANSAEVKLIQHAKPVLEADKASVAEAEKPFSAEGGNGNFELKYNLDYEVESSADWISITKTRNPQVATIAFTVQKNQTPMSRKGSIVVSAINNSEIGSLTVTISQEAGEGRKPDAPLNMTAKQIAADIHAGWNIGNTLEAISNGNPSETAWGNPKVNEAYIKGIKAAGFNAVRIPCAWNGYIIDKNNYTIDPMWLNRVEEVIGYCINNGMYAIINIHWDGGWLEENVNEAAKPAVLPKQKALWTQIAERFSAFNERLMFAGTNEPYQSRQNEFGESEMSVLLEYEQAFIDAVRAAGGNNLERTLIFQGPATNIDLTEKLMKSIPTDIVPDRLMAEIHYYDPWNFCGMEKDEDWGKMQYFWGERNHMSGSDRNCSRGEEDYMKGQFDKMKALFVDRGIPVVIGEYGAILQRNLSGAEAEYYLASRAYFDKCVSQFGKERGLVPFLWDTGEIIDRYSGNIKVPEIVNAIMDGSEAGKYPF